MAMAKRLGIALSVLGCVSALFGAGSASATRLCKEEGVAKKCPTEKAIYKEGTALEMVQSVNSVFTFGIKNECLSSVWKGSTANAGGSGEKAFVFSGYNPISWGECTCKTTAVEPPIEIWFLGNGNRNGTIASFVAVEFGCAGFSCVYEGEVQAPIEGGNQAKFSVKGTLKRTFGGFPCTEAATWTASYVYAEPIPMFITEG